jgi:hypothetical protein
MTTKPVDRHTAAITEAAVREVARHAIADAVRLNPPRWEDYPDIGEHDWEAIAAEVERVLDRLAAQREKYDCAYRVLAGRADGAA